MARRPPPLARRRPSRNPRIAITIYSEGENTETDYFKTFALQHGNMLVRLEIIGKAGVPLTMVETAVSERKRQMRQRKNSFEKKDQIWVVFDCDEHPHIPTAMAKAKAGGVEVAFSNPCFELWALLHLTDHGAPLDRHALQRRLKNEMPKYDPNGAKLFDYELLRDAYSYAVQRAERLERARMDERDPLGNPYTSVYKLTTVIVENGKIGKV